jgi:putative intracellular protease/amidase
MRRVLMVVSSQSVMNSGAAAGSPTGLWLEELAASYFVFVDAGCDVTIASPKGGAAPVDALSLQEPWLTASGSRFNENALATRRLRESVPLSGVDAEGFDAIYLVGGAATAWDFPNNAPLAQVIASLFRRGSPVAGVCHGVLGLTGARDVAGMPIVAGRAVTGISNAEETLTGFDKLVPVLPESRLVDLGAKYSCAAPFSAFVACDGNLLTGQNPASAGPLAQAVLRQLA